MKVAIETIGDPRFYEPAQIRRAFDIAYALGRGRFVLAEMPNGTR